MTVSDVSDESQGAPGLSRLDREILRTYAGGGDVSPLDAPKGRMHSAAYDAELKQMRGKHRGKLLMGYVSLVVIVLVGSFIIWRIYLWSAENLADSSLLDRFEGKSPGEIINPQGQ
jgi:hypothetical protein